MVSILCADERGCYATLGADVWGITRDAFNWPGGHAAVCHPPCRLWGRLRQFAKCSDPERERNLGLFCIRMVNRWGGVVEQPAGSGLFRAAGVVPSVEVPQYWWGHRSIKMSWLYVVGVSMRQLPEMPFKFERYVGGGNGAPGSVARMGKREREATPLEFGRWLIRVAELANQNLRVSAGPGGLAVAC